LPVLKVIYGKPILPQNSTHRTAIASVSSVTMSKGNMIKQTAL